jgi:hypothetical protein
VASGALETRGYDRITLELIECLVWDCLPSAWREPALVDPILFAEAVQASQRLAASPPNAAAAVRLPLRSTAEVAPDAIRALA